MKNVKEKFLAHPLLYSLWVSVIIGVAGIALFTMFDFDLADIGIYIIALPIFILFLVYPFVLTVINIILLFMSKENRRVIDVSASFEVLTIVLGIIYSLLYFFCITEIKFADWTEQLYNNEVHFPISKEYLLTVVIIWILACLGYIFLRCKSLKHQPPLLTVLCISAMYLGVAESIFWIIQVGFSGEMYFLLSLFPFNCIIFTFKTIWNLVVEMRAMTEEAGAGAEKNHMGFLKRILCDSRSWPLLALFMAVPLLGLIVAILALFGQAPDAVIKAWTETADWTLSQRVAPPNLHSGHYLCTVAAGGHENVVKPLRLGKRHGHVVVVNRQLCIANAFEQILEERLPLVHRGIRSFYDRYGYPIAKHIHSPYAADVVYILMKPLEWFFLAVIYLCDAKPENRIAVQYPPEKPPICGSK